MDDPLIRCEVLNYGPSFAKDAHRHGPALPLVSLALRPDRRSVCRDATNQSRNHADCSTDHHPPESLAHMSRLKISDPGTGFNARYRPTQVHRKPSENAHIRDRARSALLGLACRSRDHRLGVPGNHGSLPLLTITYYDIVDVEIHRSARRHGVSDTAILHALDHAVTVIDLESDADPPKVLAIGPDHAGNLLEVIWLELADDVNLVIHAMALRPTFYELLPQTREDMP